MITIVELPEFVKRSERFLKESERKNIVNYLAVHSTAGVVMKGTGGIRKLRWKKEGTGKRGGVRIIYYYYNKQYPLFLLTVFRKSEKVNLSKAERNELAKLTRILIEGYGE